jgi:DNA-binding MarR family transcriptional regulator
MPEDAMYARLLALRTALRRFEQWSAAQARAAGLTPAQHQLLLAIKGHADPRGPTVSDVAEYLLLRHHSVVGLIDRAEEAGLISRRRNDEDQRVVRLKLTRTGLRRLRALTDLHVEELAHLVPMLERLEAPFAGPSRAS